MRTTLGFVLFITILARPAECIIIDVPGDQPTIQAGIDSAMDGDEVVVAVGTWFQNINFNGKAITLRSTDPTNRDIVSATIIDGNNVSSPVVRCWSGEGPDTVLSGFTITNGNAVTGGGMACSNCNPTVTHCIFRQNSGGGLYYSSFGDVTISDCRFVQNSSGSKLVGGGLTLRFVKSASISRCLFAGNSADQAGGAVRAAEGSGGILYEDCTFRENSATFGGAVSNGQPATTMFRCSFDNNSAGLSGGAIAGGNMDLRSCIFTQNRVIAPFFGGGGGAIAAGNAVISNCLLDSNSAFFGGAISSTSNLRVINCTMTNNVAEELGGAIYATGMSSIDNSILWDNDAQGGFQVRIEQSSVPPVDSSLRVSHCTVQDGESGVSLEAGSTLEWLAGNLDADPLLVSAGTGDFRLSSDSPSIDAGDNAAVPSGTATDLNGNSRIVDGDSNGEATVDMGAFEFQAEATPVPAVSEQGMIILSLILVAGIVAMTGGRRPVA